MERAMIAAIERVTRVMFGVLFGGLLLALAAETAIRRRIANRRRRAAEGLDAAYRARPKTRPTIGWVAPVPMERPRRSGV
jgi:hypothetical protein